MCCLDIHGCMVLRLPFNPQRIAILLSGRGSSTLYPTESGLELPASKETPSLLARDNEVKLEEEMSPYHEAQEVDFMEKKFSNSLVESVLKPFLLNLIPKNYRVVHIPDLIFDLPPTY